MIVCFNPTPDDSWLYENFIPKNKENVYKPFVPIWYEEPKIELWQNKSEQTR